VAVLAGCVKYHPSPLNPPRLEKEYRSRDLAGADVRAYIESSLGRKPAAWPPASLDLPLLTALAFYYNPELDVARARVRAADAGVITAEGRINPSLSIGGGYSNDPESALLFRFVPTFTIETAGKRGYRILQARKLAAAARAELTDAAWRVRSRVRAALLTYLFARRRRDLLAGEVAVRVEAVTLFEKRLEAGEVSRPDVDAAEIEASNTRVQMRAAEGQVSVSLARLGAAAGLTEAALRGIKLECPGVDAPPAAEELSIEKVQQAGLLHRADVRRSLLEYAAAEAALHLEIAKQYPDIELSPGYDFDEAHHKFTLSPGFTVPLFNRNQGPIAEANTRRTEAAARFVALQARAIAEMETSLAGYRAALRELREADRRLLRLQREKETSIRRAFEVGEEDRLALAGVRIQTAVAARVRLEALHEAQTALGALEDAEQSPLPAGIAWPAFPVESPRAASLKRVTP